MFFHSSFCIIKIFNFSSKLTLEKVNIYCCTSLRSLSQHFHSWVLKTCDKNIKPGLCRILMLRSGLQKEFLNAVCHDFCFFLIKNFDLSSSLVENIRSSKLQTLSSPLRLTPLFFRKTSRTIQFLRLKSVSILPSAQKDVCFVRNKPFSTIECRYEEKQVYFLVTLLLILRWNTTLWSLWY